MWLKKEFYLLQTLFIFLGKKRYAADGEEQTVLESMRDYLLNTIQKTFEVGVDQAECLYQELLQCTRNKNLVKDNGKITEKYLPFSPIPILDNCVSNPRKTRG